MKIPDVTLQSPIIQSDSTATAQMAALIAKVEDLFRDIYANLHTIPVVSSAPATTEVNEQGMPDGSIRSDVKILDDSTQTNRKLYYKFKGNLRLIDSA